MASGLTLIFSMMGVLNFAHASFYMLGPIWGSKSAAPASGRASLLARWSTRLRHAGRALRDSQRAQAWSCRGIAVHLWPGFRYRGSGGHLLGQIARRLRVPRPRLLAFRLFDTNYPAYKLFMLAARSPFSSPWLFAMLTRTRLGASSCRRRSP